MRLFVTNATAKNTGVFCSICPLRAQIILPEIHKR